jgi:hypothetical protein
MEETSTPGGYAFEVGVGMTDAKFIIRASRKDKREFYLDPLPLETILEYFRYSREPDALPKLKGIIVQIFEDRACDGQPVDFDWIAKATYDAKTQTSKLIYIMVMLSGEFLSASAEQMDGTDPKLMQSLLIGATSTESLESTSVSNPGTLEN